MSGACKHKNHIRWQKWFLQPKTFSDYAGSDFTRTPALVKVASQALPFLIKCALQFPLLLSFHSLTAALPNRDLKAVNTAGGGAAKTDVVLEATLWLIAGVALAIKNIAEKIVTAVNIKTFFMMLKFK